MKLSGNKKIILLGMILLIIAGIVVVALKGVKVSLTLQQHEAINIYVGKNIEIKEIKNICKEVLEKKDFTLRRIDVFNDAVTLNVESITNEEKDAIISKISEKYGIEMNENNISDRTISNVRVRDMIGVYVKPVIISTILIFVYMVIRFRKESAAKLLGKIVGIIILTEALIASFVAVCRIPLSPTLINVMAVIAVLEIIIYINRLENPKQSEVVEKQK